MSAPHIDCYYFGASPFAYLGHDALCRVATEHGATVAWKPVDLFALWEVSGAVLPPKRPPVRQRYRLLELQRVANYRGLPINLKPAFWPLDVTLCDSCAIAISQAGVESSKFVSAVLTGVWARDENMADEATVRAALIASGHDADAIIEAAGSQSVADERAANTQAAIDADAVGVPAYVLNGEVFWGQDRIEYLDQALKTKRAPLVIGA